MDKQSLFKKKIIKFFEINTYVEEKTYYFAFY